MAMYKNPFQIPGEDSTGDPFIMRYNGSYYFYKTSHIHDAVCAWKSDNLVDWDSFHIVCNVPQAHGAYAPEVHYINGRFYMVTSSRGNGHFMYAADDPFGPFECISGRFGQRIDGTLFLDDNGDEYFLRAEHGGINYHRVPAPDQVDIAARVIPESNLGGWTEGPLVLRRGKYYFLTYTGNHLYSRGYRVDYSVSQTSPVQGYVNMNDKTLLLQVEDEFHALGHSSSVLAPDMDGAYITYHNYDFGTAPRFEVAVAQNDQAKNPVCRTVNVDRLFFNGARMYANTAWWPQEKPRLPRFFCRGGEALRPKGDYAIFPEMPLERYTAEFNFTLKNGPVQILYGDGILEITAAGVQAVENGKIAAMAAWPRNTALDRNITLRMARRADGEMLVTLNIGQNLLSWKSAAACGELGISRAAVEEDKYFALSDEAFGSSDRLEAKAVPGRFDAVHAAQEPEMLSSCENGMEVFYVPMKEGQKLTFPINVRRDGKYALAVLADKGDKDFLVESAGEKVRMQGKISFADHDGRGWKVLGEISLKKGYGEIAVTAMTDERVDSFRLIAADEVECGDYIAESRLVKPSNVIGSKNEESMISKAYGFSSSEGPNFAFAGKDGWRDLRVKARVHVLKMGDGFASILLRATKESWYEHQVKDSVDAIEVCFDREGVHVNRLNYGKTALAFAAMDFDRAWLDVVCEICENTLKVQVDGMLDMQLHMAMPPLSGKLGLRFDTESFGFSDLSVEKI